MKRAETVSWAPRPRPFLDKGQKGPFPALSSEMCMNCKSKSAADGTLRKVLQRQADSITWSQAHLVPSSFWDVGVTAGISGVSLQP